MHALRCLSLTWVVAGLWGCSDGGGAKLSTVPVSGVVTYKGQPLPGANVGFLNKDRNSGKPANGVTDAQGRFQLKTFLGGAKQAKGALPGEYVVTVNKMTNLASPMDSGQGPPDPSQGPPAGVAGQSLNPEKAQEKMESEAKGKALVPAKYTTGDQTPLTATVKPSGNEPFSFDLQD